MWGHRFENIVHYDRKNEIYVADFDKFDHTVAVDTPLCSAKRLNEVFIEVNDFLESHTSIDNTPMLRHKVSKWRHKSIANAFKWQYSSLFCLCDELQLSEAYSNDPHLINEIDDKSKMTNLAEELQIRLSQYSDQMEQEQEQQQEAAGTTSDLKHWIIDFSYCIFFHVKKNT